MKQITIEQIEQKAVDSINATSETKSGNAKSFDRKEINDKVNKMIKSCLKND